MENLVAAPVLVPLVAAVATLLLRGRLQQLASVLGGIGTLVASTFLLSRTWAGEILVLRLGSWEPRVGIVWVADGLCAAMLVAASLVFLAVLACSGAGWSRQSPPQLVHPLMQLLVMGVNGAFVTGDFFNLFVFYEVMLLSSFGLIVSGQGSGRFERTIPYVLVSLVASAIFLIAVGAIYAMAGTVNMAELAAHMALGSIPKPLWAALGLMLAAFAIKTGLAPVFIWLPDSYPAAPLTVTALFAALLTKVGFYTLLRATPLLFPSSEVVWHTLVALGAVTMAIGVLGALGRSTIRGILSFHIVSQIGYMVFGLGLGTSAALGAALLFTVHNMLIKPALVLAGGVAERLGGTGEIKSLGGLAQSFWAAAAFFIPAMALAGLPPLSGFWGKLLLVRAGFAAGAWWATGVALLVSMLTLASMLKIWSAVYWSGKPEKPPPSLSAKERQLVASALGLTVLSVAFGVAIGPLSRFAEQTARQILAVRPYLDAVLGETR